MTKNPINKNTGINRIVPMTFKNVFMNFNKLTDYVNKLRNLLVYRNSLPTCLIFDANSLLTKIHLFPSLHICRVYQKMLDKIFPYSQLYSLFLYISYSYLNAIIANTIYVLFFEYRRVKAYIIKTSFRKHSTGFISVFPHFRYQRKDARPICEYNTPENYKQGDSDPCFPSEPIPVGRIEYQVSSNCLASNRGFDEFAYHPYQTPISKHTPLARMCALSARVIGSIPNATIFVQSLYYQMSNYMSSPLIN